MRNTKVINKIIQVFVTVVFCQTAIASDENKAPEFIEEFALEVTTKVFSFVEKSKALDDGSYSVSVVVSDRKCIVVVEPKEIEARTLQGDFIEPLIRPLVESIECKPNE